MSTNSNSNNSKNVFESPIVTTVLGTWVETTIGLIKLTEIHAVSVQANKYRDSSYDVWIECRSNARILVVTSDSFRDAVGAVMAITSMMRRCENGLIS